jgi:hypothetical protein
VRSTATFRNVRNPDVSVFGTLETYSMDGIDLSNHVTVGQGPTTKQDADPCLQWPDVLAGSLGVSCTRACRAASAPSIPSRRLGNGFTAYPAATKVFGGDGSGCTA